MASNYLAKGLKRSALTVALGLCFAGGVQAQSTTGSINGDAGAGAKVTVQNQQGLTRTVNADASGRYNISSLPVGTYTVTIERDGQVVGTRTVTVLAGAGTDASATTLETVTVVGGAVVNPIDISAVDTRSILTAEQLQRLPLARSAEAVALLAPGAVSGAAGFFGGLVSFGGSGVSENAYYVNGYFTGEPLSNLGGFSLPWGAIEQQETFIGGYSAKYGRSDGGVINQIGKRGTNEWKFGGQVTYTPKSLRGDADDLYFPDLDLPAGYEYTDSELPGTLHSRGSESNAWSESYNLYVGGPILKDRLFIFAAGELVKNESRAAPSALATPRITDTSTDRPKIYGKIDWNITDNHFVELSYLREETDQDGVFYNYDFETATIGSQQTSVPDPFEQTNEYMIAKYTGYLTDSLTFSATYGRADLSKQQINPSIVPGLPFLGGITNQNPAYTGAPAGSLSCGTTCISNTQGGAVGVDAEDKTRGLRADLEWVIGDHTLTFGMDNIEFEAINEGQDQLVDRWIYGRTTSNIVPGHVGSPVTPDNPRGFYVQELIFRTATSMSLDQKAWYIEDRWQVTDNFLLSLGIRNDRFTNKNNFGETYLDAKDQWAPRLGFAWDVNGDSTFKVFGNAGRYFLALPNNVAIRGASASTFTREYFNYTGIAPDGTPTGLTPVPRTDGGSGAYSSNGEYGQPIDVKAFAPSDLKNMYQDEFILGMEHTLANNWMIGAKLTSRNLKSSVDDVCDPYTLMDAQGLTPENFVDGQFIASNDAGKYYAVSYCYMFNPGGTNTFSLAETDINGNETGSRGEFVMSNEDWRFDQGLKRVYTGLDIYLERPFDGKWEARLDYTFSKSRGNNEGQVKSEFGQANISKTQDWDAAEIMRYSYGYLANDRRHQIKLRGSYMITDELLVGANVRFLSGAPISCLGFFNPDGTIDEGSIEADPIGYGASYHTCFGEVATPGSKRTPWTKTVDLGLTYTPAFFDKKVTLGVQVRNVLNENETLQVDVTSEDDPYTVSNTYLLPIGRQTPRTVVFTASYDW
jgi:TonB dependent receptor/Carboxypeptidase regulatory-like domain